VRAIDTKKTQKIFRKCPYLGKFEFFDRISNNIVYRTVIILRGNIVAKEVLNMERLK